MLTSREHRQSAEGVGMYRVQREWACSECRGSGHVVSAEGVGMYRVQREWACTDSETGHQMRRCLAMP